MALAAVAFEQYESDFVAIDYARRTEELSWFTGLNLGWMAKGGQYPQPVCNTASPVQPRGWEADFLGQDVSRFFYKWGGTFSAVLTRLRGRYDGDLDQFLIHLVFMLTDLASANAMVEARVKGAVTVIRRRRGLNVLSLADITRIPRESVRRKLALMVDRGLVVREPDGLYYPGPASDIDAFFFALSPLFWDGARPG